MVCECIQCKAMFEYTETDARLDYSGYGYTAKLVECPNCKQINIVKFIEDKNLNINNDERYYR